MKKRSRPSFFRHLDEDYARRQATRGAAVAKVQSKGVKGVIDMSIQHFVGLAVFFVMLACLGSAASTYAIIDLAGHGPRGEQGVQGPQGEQGPIGLKGLPGNDASQEMIKRLAGLWSVQQASVIAGGGFGSFNDPIVGSCVK